MKFKFIRTKDPEYSKELMLRWEVLHKPFGLPPGSEVMEGEGQSLHLIALDGKKVVGCVLFHPESPSAGRLCEMAVSDEYQGRGFGRQLIATLEQALIKRGVQELLLDARQELVEFYATLGYRTEGVPVERMGTSVQLMKKNLQ